MKFLIISIVILLIILILKRSSFVATAAKLAFQKGETGKALKLYEKADKIGNLDAANKMYFGYILLRTGNLERARIILAEASMMHTKDNIKNRIKAMRALVMWKEGHIKDAIESLEELIAEFKTTTVYQDLGLLYILDGDKEKALSFNLEAYDYNADDMVILDNLAEAYALCEMNDKAEETYKILLEKEPHFPEAYYGYGLLLIKKGEKEKGLELMRQSLDKRFSFLSIMQKSEVEELIKKYE